MGPQSFLEVQLLNVNNVFIVISTLMLCYAYRELGGQMVEVQGLHQDCIYTRKQQAILCRFQGITCEKNSVSTCTVVVEC